MQQCSKWTVNISSANAKTRIGICIHLYVYRFFPNTFHHAALYVTYKGILPLSWTLEIQISFASGESCRNAWVRWFLSLRHCLDSIEQSGISKEHVLNLVFARLAFQKLPWIKVSFLGVAFSCQQTIWSHFLHNSLCTSATWKKNTEKIRDNPQPWTQNQSTVLEVWHRHHDHLLRTSRTTSGAAK